MSLFSCSMRHQGMLELVSYILGKERFIEIATINFLPQINFRQSGGVRKLTGIL